MVKRIYSLPGCVKCLQAKKKYPTAEHIMITSLSDDEKNKLFERFAELNISSAPVLEDETGKILSHEEAGL